MSQENRDWYRRPMADPDPGPESWGRSRATWVLVGVVVLAWLLPGTAGRARLEDALGLHPLRLPERAWTLLWYEFLAPQGGATTALACLALLWFFARDVERDRGPGTMVVTFFLGALVAGLAAGVLARVSNDPRAFTGAHGGTCALVVRWSMRRRHDALAGLPTALVAAVAIVVPSLARFLEAGDRVAFAWPAGTLPGLLLERLAARGERDAVRSLLPPVGPAEEPDEDAPRESPAARTRRRVDELLGKIQRKGLDALTKEEREFLAAASREFRDGR